MSKASRKLQRDIENAKYTLIHEWYLEHDFSAYFVKPESVPDSAQFNTDYSDDLETDDAENMEMITLSYKWKEDKVSFKAQTWLQIEYDCAFTYEDQLPVSVDVTVTNYKLLSDEEYNIYYYELEDEDDDYEVDEADEPGDALDEDE